MDLTNGIQIGDTVRILSFEELRTKTINQILRRGNSTCIRMPDGVSFTMLMDGLVANKTFEVTAIEQGDGYYALIGHGTRWTISPFMVEIVDEEFESDDSEIDEFLSRLFGSGLVPKEVRNE